VREIVKKLRKLPGHLQYRILLFVDALQASSLHGAPGKDLLQFAGTISQGDLDLMRTAIEAGCEQIPTSEW